MSNTVTIKSILKNKKFVLLLVVASLFLIISTALISTYIVNKRSGYEYLAVINEDLSFTKTVLLEKQNSICITIDCKTAESPEKYSGIYEKAHLIELKTNALVEKIDGIIEEIIDDCGGKDNDYTYSMNFKGDISSARKVFESFDEASSLQEDFKEYKKLLLSSIKDTSILCYKSVDRNLNYLNSLIDNESHMQQEVLYSELPSIGTLNLLLQLQIKIRLSAIETIQFLLYNLEGLDLRINALSVYTGEQIGKLYIGDTFVSKIGMIAIDTAMKPVVYISYSEPFYDSVYYSGAIHYKLHSDQTYDTLLFSSAGSRTFKIKCVESGMHYYGGLVHFRSNIGDLWLPFNGEYVVQ